MPPDTASWISTTKNALKDATLGPRTEYRGRVEEIGDGVAMISGLRDVRLDEVLRFEGGQVGFARVLDPDLIGCVLLDAATDVEAGDAVFGTGAVAPGDAGALTGAKDRIAGADVGGRSQQDATARIPLEDTRNTTQTSPQQRAPRTPTGKHSLDAAHTRIHPGTR